MSKKERITVRPVYLKPYGWILRLRMPRGSASPSGYWGGNGKASPQEALDTYGPRVIEALPSFNILLKPPTRAQLNRAPEI